MSEKLFRGKRTDNGEWVEGYLYRISEKLNPFIMLKNAEGESYEVDPETVGQYIGVEDNSGTMIFEGDILRDDDSEENGVVVFEEGEFCVVFGNVEAHVIADIAFNCYVRGNIHDNPELLEG